MQNFKWMIKRNYRVNFMIDNLPAIYQEYFDDDSSYETEVGFPLGYDNSDGDDTDG